MSGDQIYELVSEIIRAAAPDYDELRATAEKAKAWADELRSQMPAAMQHPPRSVEQLSPEWLNGEVGERLGTQDIETRLQVLKEVEVNNRAEANDLRASKNDEVIEAFADHLRAFVAEWSAAVDDLGPGIDTAAKAIDADKVDTWRVLHADARTYRQIRAEQYTLLHRYAGMFDGSPVGDGDPEIPNSPAVADKEARLYYHRNLETIALDWKSSDLPWPSDATERLVWCIRHDSGIWCPTPDQLNGLVRPVPPRLAGGAPGRMHSEFIPPGPQDHLLAPAPSPTMTGGGMWTTPLNAR